LVGFLAGLSVRRDEMETISEFVESSDAGRYALTPICEVEINPYQTTSFSIFLYLVAKLRQHFNRFRLDQVEIYLRTQPWFR
jgi:hypothetical protein